MSPIWSQQAFPRDGARSFDRARTNTPSARKNTAKSNEPFAFAPSAPSPARGATELPREIDFLKHYGVSFTRLANAAEKARAHGVTADRVLIAEGHIIEEEFYRALARHLRLRFTDADIALNAGATYPKMIEDGAVAVATHGGAVSLIAPRGAAISHWIDALSRREQTRNIVLTTPSHLSWLVRRAAHGEIVRAASFDLPEFDASYCARGGMNAPQGAALAAAACVAAVSLYLAPLAAITAGAALLGTSLLATFWLRLSACAASPAPQPPSSRPLREDELPLYSVIIALYREAPIVPQLLKAIAKLDYSRAKLDVKLVLEHDDRETLAALQHYGVPPYCELLVAPPGTPQTKPRALNVALPLLRSELVAVYDAEDIPDPQQLRLAASRFAVAPARVACLQAQLAIDNMGNGWLAALFAIEYAALFDVINPGLSALGIPFSLGGTSNHFRTEALRHVGGWDAWNVTEDADIGFRLARFGYDAETLTSTTDEEAPVSLAMFFRQRRRWCKGWYQTLIVLWRQPRRLWGQTGFARACALGLVVLGNVLGPLSAPLCAICVGVDVCLGAKALPCNAIAAMLVGLWVMVILAGSATGLWPALKAMKRRRLSHLWPVLFLLPAYSLIICVAAWAALYDLIWHPYHWLKTEHGQARRGTRGGTFARRLIEALIPMARD